jgi:WD40 repeat protein/serine/threonine protein kinase
MSTTEAERLRELVALCLDRIESEGSGAIEAVCREHPEDAAAIRERLQVLARSGLLERPAPPDPASVPEKLGDFRLLRKLGEGGMGVVYLALQESLKREVALKLVRPDQLWFSGARERFRREVDAIARLQHPGVVPIHAVGEEAGIPFFAMEKVAGATLSDVVTALAGEEASRLEGRDLARAIAARASAADGPAADASEAFVFDGSWTEACFRVVRQVAEALDHVHRRGVLHRDLKPSNVMVTRAGRAMVLDFGLASTSGAMRLTRSGTRLGSLPYLAPEQSSGKGDRVDERTDVYALGVTLYELLTLRVPFAESSAEALMRTIEVGRPESIRTLNRSVPKDAETVCLTAMERDPARRYGSAAAFARDLDNVLHHRPIEARPPGPALRVKRWLQRHPALGVAVVLGSLLVVGGPTTFGWMEHASKLRLDKAYRRADGLRLSGRSSALLATDPGLALLIAIEGAQRTPGAAANDALQAALAACREEHALAFETGGVAAACFSPDGTRVATGSSDGSATLWDAASGAESRLLLGHGDGVRSVAFAPDGRRLLTAAGDGQARLWEVDSGRCVAILRGARGALNGARFSGDGRRILTFSADGAAMLWDATDPAEVRLLRTFADLGGAVADASLSPEGRTLVAAAADGRARVVDVESGERVATLELGGAVWSARFSPAGDRLALCGRATAARLFDVATWREAVPPLQHADLVGSVDWSPDGTRLLTSSWDHTVVVWDARSGERLVTLRGQRRIARFARFSPDASLVFAGGDDSTGYLWNARSGRLVALFRGQAGTLALGEFSRDGRRLLSVCNDARLWTVPIAARRLEWEGHRDKVESVAVSRDGTRLVTASRDGTAKIWDAQTLELERTLVGHAGRLHSAAFSSDGRRVVTAAYDSTASVWDAGSGDELAVLRGHHDLLNGSAFDPTGERVVTSSKDGTTGVWDWRAQRRLLELTVNRGEVVRSGFSPDGSRVVAITRDGAATVFDAASGAIVSRFDETGGAARLASFTLDGRRVLVALADRSVTSWELASGRNTPLLPARGGKPQTISIAPNGWCVAVSGDDGAIRLWDTDHGELLESIVGHDDLVPFTAFSRDGATLVSASFDGDVRWRPVDPLAAALAAKPRELTAEEHVELEVGDVAAWRDAIDGVRTLADRCAVAGEVVEAAGRADLGDAARAAALSIARGLRDRPLTLARASFAIAHSAGRGEAEYRLALRRAEAASRLAPEDGVDRSLALASLALAHARLGELDLARAAVEKLRVRAADPAGAAVGVASWLQEAEAALAGASGHATPPSGR